MLNDVAMPINTRLTDVSILLENSTSSILMKREDTQITGSHKYRLAYSLINEIANGYNDGIDFVVATSGNTGLAVANIARQLNKKVTIFASRSIKPNTEYILNSYPNATIIKSSDDVISEAKNFCVGRDDLIYLNQYDNIAGTYGFMDMAKEIEEEYPLLNAMVLGVGTGASIYGCMRQLPNIDFYAATVSKKDFITIPGIRNFGYSTPGNLIIEANEIFNILKWYNFTVDEIFDTQKVYSETIDLNINLSTTLSLMAARVVGNEYNYTNIVTICTGLE